MDEGQEELRSIEEILGMGEEIVSLPAAEEPVFVRIYRATLSDLARRWRVEADRTVFEFAAALGCEPRRVVEMEMGNDDFDSETLDAIARLVNKTTMELYKEIVWRYSQRCREYEGL